MFVASTTAIFQENVRKLFAYSSLAQIGYITLGISFDSVTGLTATVVHLLNHAAAKGAVFLLLGGAALAMGGVSLAQLRGMGRVLPVTAFGIVLCGLSLIGIPGTAGFVSKWYIVSGAFSAELVLPAIVLLASTLLNAAYFMPIVYAAFFRAPAAGDPVHGEAPWPSVLALAVTAGLTVTLFFVPGLPLSLAAALVGRS